MSSPYRRVLAIRGAVPFSLAGIVARLPISMVSLGIVLLVSDRTGSYAIAGGVSAAYVGANAVGAVPLARLLDQLGQGRVLGVAASVSAVALAMLMIAVELAWPVPLPHLFAALSGLTMPNVGAAIRARWSYALDDRSLLDTAFAVEAVNDELVFVVGPTLTTLLASVVHPLAGLVTAGVSAVVGCWALVAQRRTQPPPQRASRAQSAARNPLPWARLVPAVAGAVMLGMLFGGSEVSVVAFADEHGHRAGGGVLLAIWAFGSLLAGVVTGRIMFRRGAAARYRIGTACLALLMAPLPLIHDTLLLAVFLFLAGFAISPTLIAAFSWVESVTPRDRLTEGMTVFSTGMVAGVAPGAAFVGAVVDRAGASASFWVPAAAGVLAAVLALAVTPTVVPASVEVRPG